MNKYHNIKTVVDGYKFDSLKEANYYRYLKQEKKAKRILDFERQPIFTLMKGFREADGTKVRDIKYKADFLVYHDGKVEVIDVKGGRATQTQAWKIKWKLLKSQYQLQNQYIFTII